MTFPSRNGKPRQINTVQIDCARTSLVFLLLSFSSGVHAKSIEFNNSLRPVYRQASGVTYGEKLLDDKHLDSAGRAFENSGLKNETLPTTDLSGSALFHGPGFPNGFPGGYVQEPSHAPEIAGLAGESTENKGEATFVVGFGGGPDGPADFQGILGFSTDNWHEHLNSSLHSAQQSPASPVPATIRRNSRACLQSQRSQKLEMQERCDEGNSSGSMGGKTGANGLGRSGGGVATGRGTGVNNNSGWSASGPGNNTGGGAGGIPFGGGGGGSPGGGNNGGTGGENFYGGKPDGVNDPGSLDSGSGAGNGGVTDGESGVDIRISNGYEGGAWNQGPSEELPGADPGGTRTVPEPGSASLFVLGLAALCVTHRRSDKNTRRH
jgi:hypothetical protein